MGKQTAVEWLEKNIRLDANPFEILKCFNQAREMERQQIEGAYDKGWDDGVLSLGFDPTGSPEFDDGKDYYTETYKKDGE